MVLLNGIYTDPGWRSEVDKDAAKMFAREDFEVIFYFIVQF